MPALTYADAEASMKFGDYQKATRFLMQQEQARLVEQVTPKPTVRHKTQSELLRAGRLDHTRKNLADLEEILLDWGCKRALLDFEFIRRDFEELAAHVSGEECQCQDHVDQRSATEALDRAGMAIVADVIQDMADDDADAEMLEAAAAWCRS